jgi:hypothetical protein
MPGVGRDDPDSARDAAVKLAAASEIITADLGIRTGNPQMEVFR